MLEEPGGVVPNKPIGGQKINFGHLRRANVARYADYPQCEEKTIEHWAMCVGGEAGELLNTLKKWCEGDTKIYVRGEKVPLNLKVIGDEIADIVIYADILAEKLGLNLGECVRSKFNEVSERVGSAVRL